MEIQRLRYFVALTRERGFAKAAEACRVSQPTLSQQIALLERELGVPLVRRIRGAATPTEAGRDFLKRAVNILAELDYAAQEAASHAGRLRGVIRLGAIPTVAPYVIPDLVAEFATTNPEVTVEVYENVTAGLESSLRDGTLDAAVLALPVRSENLRRVVLREDTLLAAVPTDHPAAAAGSLAWSDIADEPWLMLEESHCLAVATRELCARSGVKPRVAARAAQIATLLGMVSRGLGVAVAPAMAAGMAPDGVAFVPFSGRKTSRTIALVTRMETTTASPVLRAFADHARRFVAGKKNKPGK